MIMEESKYKRYCSVPQCSTYRTDEITLHYFPKNEELKKNWAVALGIEKPVTKYMSVCSRHFTKEDYFPTAPFRKVKYLKPTAIPLCYLPQRSLDKSKTQNLHKGRCQQLDNEGPLVKKSTSLVSLNQQEAQMETLEHSIALFDCNSTFPNGYSCPNCSLVTNYKVTMLNHQKDTCRQPTNTITSFSCQDCHLQTYSIIVLLKHLVDAEHSNKMDWMECDHCGYRTTRNGNLKMHYLRKHTKPINTKSFKCGKCDYEAKTLHHLKSHNNWKHNVASNIKWFKCEQCAYQTKQGSNLKQHVSAMHENGEKIKWFTCDNCSFKSKYKAALKSHVLSKHTEPEYVEWFKCEQCAYQAKQKRSLKRHISEVHEKGKNIKCEQCAYQCKQKRSLKRHVMRKHPIDDPVY